MSRTTIIDEIYQAITGVTAFENKTFWGAPQYGVPLPYVTIRANSDNYSDKLNSTTNSAGHNLLVDVVIMDDVSTTPSNDFDTYITDIEEALFTSADLASSVADMYLEGVEFEYVENGETPLAQATMTLNIEYVNGVVYDPTFGAANPTDHGLLSGLGDDDHTQYHNDTRAEIWLTGNNHDVISATTITATTYQGIEFSEIENTGHTHTHSYTKNLDVLEPVDGDTITMVVAEKETSIVSASTIIVGSSTPSVEWTLYTGTSRTSGTQLGTGTSNNTTSPVFIDVDKTIPTNSMVWVTLGNVGGTVSNFGFTLYLQD